MTDEVTNITNMEGSSTGTFPEWEDQMLESYWMMNSPVPMIVLLCVYLLFVTTLGPRLMEGRKPFMLKYTMMVYNIVQVMWNMWFLWEFFKDRRFLVYILEEACYPVIPSRNKTLRLYTMHLTWIWLMSKVADLLDTVFFVLRKKQSHVSFLHVYHHTHMVFVVWLYLKYVRGEQAIMIGVVNSSVHTAMYSYYFLSALGPRVQRYLWWKKYITWLQLFQFFLLMVFFLCLLVACRVPPLQTAYNVYALAQGFVFSALFLNFYFKSYSKPAQKSSHVPLKAEINANTDYSDKKD